MEFVHNQKMLEFGKKTRQNEIGKSTPIFGKSRSCLPDGKQGLFGFLRKKEDEIMKKGFLALVVASLLGAGVGSAVAASDVKVQVDGSSVRFPDAKPFIEGTSNRTMVPIRFISQKLGAKVEWDGATQTVKIAKDGKQIALRIGEKRATVSGKQITFDAAARLQNNRTFVPLRFISEAYGAKVDWLAAEKLVVITTKASTVTGGIFKDAPTQDAAMLLPKDDVSQPAVEAFIDSLRFENGVVTGKVPALPPGYSINFRYKDTSDGKWGVRANDRDLNDLKAGDTFSVKVEGKGGYLTFGLFKGAEGKNGVTVTLPDANIFWGAKR